MDEGSTDLHELLRRAAADLEQMWGLNDRTPRFCSMARQAGVCPATHTDGVFARHFVAEHLLHWSKIMAGPAMVMP